MQPIIPPLKPRVHRGVAERAAWKAQEQASAARLGATVAHVMQTTADPALDTAIGRLRLGGVITPSQFAAAEAYGLLRGLFDLEMGVTRRSARLPCYGAASDGDGPFEPLSERALAVLNSDHVRLIATTRSAYPILDRVILDDQNPEPREIERLRNTFDRLGHFSGSEPVEDCGQLCSSFAQRPTSTIACTYGSDFRITATMARRS